MNKNELVAKIAEEVELKKADVEKVLEALLCNITKVMAAGDKLQLVGFGTFEGKARAEKEGVNPATGAKIKIPACKVPTFKPGKALKDEINK